MDGRKDEGRKGGKEGKKREGMREKNRIGRQ